MRRNVGAALELAGAHPDDPVAFEALKFVIRTNRAGPGGATARALRIILERGYDRRPSGAYLAHVGILLLPVPGRRAGLLRRMLDENPSRDDRGEACYWLAHYLIQQGSMVRGLSRGPRQHEGLRAIHGGDADRQLVKEKDPVALDAASRALLERVVAEFGDVRWSGETRAPGHDRLGRTVRATATWPSARRPRRSRGPTTRASRSS